MEEGGGGGGGKTEKIVNECSRGTKTGGGPRKDIVTYSVLLVCIKKTKTKNKKTDGELVNQLVGTLSPVSHRGLHQG